jgi:hypothetical protein
MTLSTKVITPASVAAPAPLSVEQANLIADLVLGGDLSKMDNPARVRYYVQLCNSLNLNPHTQPFQILKFQGKEIMYATKSCTEQLRKLWGVSVTNIEARKEGDVYLVVASVTDGTGRTDAASGVVSLTDSRGNTLAGENLANAFMKAETKAKRRATLSICGLGMLDESELDTMPQATRVSLPAEIGTSAEVVTEAPAQPVADLDEAKVAGHRTRMQYARSLVEVQQIWKEIPKHLAPKLLADKDAAKLRLAQPAKQQSVRDEQLLREFIEQPSTSAHGSVSPNGSLQPADASDAQRQEIMRLCNLQTITPKEKADMLLVLRKLDSVRADQMIFKLLNELAVREGRDANKEMRQALHRFTVNYGQQLGAEEVDRLRIVADDMSLHWQQVRAELLLAKDGLPVAA